jgi:type VI secretion system FHA domain protein
MQLRLIVVRDPRRTLGERTSHVFGEAGGTLGRNSSCDLVLADAANVISNHHAEIGFNGRGFLVTDTSTNGVYLNRVDAPLGRGNSALLTAGDLLYLGDLIFKVEIGEEARDSRARLGIASADGWTKASAGSSLKPVTPPASLDLGVSAAASVDPLGGFAPARPKLSPPRPDLPARDPLAALSAPENKEEDLLGPSSGTSSFGRPESQPLVPRDFDRLTPQNATPRPAQVSGPGANPSLPPIFPELSLTPSSSAPLPRSAVAEKRAPFSDRPSNLSGARSIPPLPGVTPPLPNSSFTAAQPPADAAPRVGEPIPDIDFGALPPPALDSSPALSQSKIVLPDPLPDLSLEQLGAPAEAPPPAASTAQRMPQPGPIPDDFFTHLAGIAGFPDKSAAPSAMPKPLAPDPLSPSPFSTDPFHLSSQAPSAQSSATAASATPIAERRVPLKPDFAASLVALGRKEGQAPFAVPTLDPVSVLRRRGEGRPNADVTRVAPVPQPSAPTSVPLPPERTAASAPRAGSQSDASEFGEFWKILGIDPAQLDPARRAAILQTLAATVRASVTGLVEVLSARTAIKDEFRMDRTRLQPDENNPLKFFRTGEEAFQRSVIERTPGFLDLDVAVRHGFTDIKAHEVATMTALQNSMKQLFQRIGPAAVEQSAGQSMFGRRPDKSKLWDQFVELYNRFADALEFSVPEIVATEFARVYHEQIEQMNRGEKQ